MKQFYELCYDQYLRELKDSDNLYQRVGFLVIVIPVLVASTAKLGRLDIVNLCLTRPDVFLFYLSSVTAAFFIVFSALFLTLCAWPRRYKTLANMDVWHKWYNKYHTFLKDECITEEQANTLEIAFFENVCPQLAEAQPINADINERRRKSFKRSIQMIAFALAAILLQAFMSLVPFSVGDFRFRKSS